MDAFIPKKEYNPLSPESLRAWKTISGQPCLLEFYEIYYRSFEQFERKQLKRFEIHELDAFMLVYDVGQKRSFEPLTHIYEKIMKDIETAASLPAVVVAAKTDIPRESWQVSAEEGRELAERLGIQFRECSAKEGVGVNEIMEQLVEASMEIRRKQLQEKLAQEKAAQEKAFQEKAARDQEQARLEKQNRSLTEKMKAKLRIRSH